MQPEPESKIIGGLPQSDPARNVKKLVHGTPSIQSLDRGLCILEAVAKSGDPVPLGQLTGLLGIERSSVFRLANTLRRRGFLANPNGRKDYILGPSIWRLSRQCDWSRVLITIGHEHLKKLAIQTGETTHLAVREGRQVLFIDHCGSTGQVLVVSGQTGEFLPLHCTAHGKALLSDFGLPELSSLYRSTLLERYTPHTITSLPQLAKACAKVRADGIASDDGEFLKDVRCMAAPVRDLDGTIVACIGISAPASRLGEERRPAAARQVMKAAEDITALLRAKTEN